jgi:putative FmdB family regulatory protein
MAWLLRLCLLGKVKKWEMPTYEFQCEKCRKRFDLNYSVAEYERAAKKKIKCPKCARRRVLRQISSFEVKTSKKADGKLDTGG